MGYNIYYTSKSLGLDSLPVAGKVNITPIGRASVKLDSPIKHLQISSSSNAPAAIAFAESITLPPPTANIKEIFSILQISIPFLTKEEYFYVY